MKQPPAKHLNAETAIIGGGVIGASIAMHLCQAGRNDILLFEKESLASGATGVCPGGIRQQFEGRADCILARRSMQFWKSINRILEPDDPFRYEQSGYLFIADTPGQLERYRRHVALQNELGIPSEILSTREISTLLPDLQLDGVVGGSYCAEDGFLEDCHGVTNLMAAQAVRSGASLILEEVLALSTNSAGWQLQTERQTVRVAKLIVAAGVDTAPLLESAGLRLPIRRERRRLAFTEAINRSILPPLLVAPERGFAGKQLHYGPLYFGWLREQPSDDDLDYLEKGLTAGATLWPPLAEVPVKRVLTGYYDSTPDYRPILGSVPGFENLLLAAGFSGHGFMIAPAVGELIAALASGATKDPLLESFRSDRFDSSTTQEDLVI